MMILDRPQPSAIVVPNLTGFDVLQFARRLRREIEPANGRPFWNPDEGDFS
jgi:hypothetical protein